MNFHHQISWTRVEIGKNGRRGEENEKRRRRPEGRPTPGLFHPRPFLKAAGAGGEPLGEAERRPGAAVGGILAQKVP
jgi:hypothetical protein